MRIKRYAESLAVETFSVVLGVSLALAASAWHDARVHAAQGREALVTIRNELAANDSILRAKLPYHRAMGDSLSALIARAKASDVPGRFLTIANWNGLEPPRLVDDAWETARSTQAIQYIPYALTIDLSRVYALQQRIVDVNRAFFASVYTPSFANGGVPALSAAASYLSDLSANEEQLAARGAAELSQVDGVLTGRGATPNK